MAEENANSQAGSMIGLLRVTIKRGINLVVRDVSSSDPYIIVRLGNQKLKTRVMKKTLNPEWNEDLTLFIKDVNEPLKLTVFDHDTLSLDDKMGDAEVNIKPFLDSVKMNSESLQEGAVLKIVTPDRNNCFAEESNIVWMNGKVTQNILLRLCNVENGQVELQLQWIDVPSLRGA